MFVVAFALSAGMPISTVAVPLSILALWLMVHLVLFAVTSMQSREDRYDLKKLWDEPPTQEEPEEDGHDRDLAYCHRCGVSLPEIYGTCPLCGGKLGY